MTKARKGGKTRRGGNRKRKGGFLAQFQKALAPYLLFQINEMQKKKSSRKRRGGSRKRRGGSRKRRGGKLRRRGSLSPTNPAIAKCQKQGAMGWKNQNMFGIKSNMAPEDIKNCNLLLCPPGNETPGCKDFREKEFGQRGGGSRKRRGGSRKRRGGSRKRRGGRKSRR